MASFIDLNPINAPSKTPHANNLWTPAAGSISSLITTNTTYDEIPMRSLIVFLRLRKFFINCLFFNVANSTSAYDIVSYANNVKSTLKRTISCDSDEKSIVTSINDFYLTEENLSQGKLQITINYNA